MDQAWACEEDFWQAGIEGRTVEHYARVLAADAFVVVPDHLLDRDDLVHQWHERVAWAEYTLSERRDVLINGETAVLSYRVRARQTDGHVYQPGSPACTPGWRAGRWPFGSTLRTPEVTHAWPRWNPVRREPRGPAGPRARRRPPPAVR